MKQAIRLGLRLAVHAEGQRARSVVVLVASAFGSWVMLAVWGMSRSQVGASTSISSSEAGLVVGGVVIAVALPVLVLMSTVARLSAVVRDRRLANLRLLGMTASQTRAVAATEVGIVTVLGTAAGAVLFLAVAPLMARVDVVGRTWTTESLMPPLAGWIVVAIAIPAVSMATAALPQRLSSHRAMVDSRNLGGPGGPSLFRLLPLALGLLVCVLARSQWMDFDDVSPWQVAVVLGGIALLGLGVLMVVPVFVALLARLSLVGGKRFGPLLTLTGRRLQSQPSGSTRVVAALMIGLFVVTGARAVLVAFFTTPQYVEATQQVEYEQTADVLVAQGQMDDSERRLDNIDGVQRVDRFPVLMADIRPDGQPAGQFVTSVIVATCAELAGPGGEPLPKCSDSAVNTVGHQWSSDSDPQSIELFSARGYQTVGDAVSIPLGHPGMVEEDELMRAQGALLGSIVLVIPPDLPGVAELTQNTDRLLVAHAGPGRDLYTQIWAAGLQVGTMVDIENYDYVQGLSAVVWMLAVVVICVGMMTFTVAGIDRALNRRRELTTLRLMGTPTSLLRSAQWLEAAAPIGLGSLLSILAGGFAGATYLSFGGDMDPPAGEFLGLAGVSALLAIVLASITVIGTGARLIPGHIRTE